MRTNANLRVVLAVAALISVFFGRPAHAKAAQGTYITDIRSLFVAPREEVVPRLAEYMQRLSEEELCVLAEEFVGDPDRDAVFLAAGGDMLRRLKQGDVSPSRILGLMASEYRAGGADYLLNTVIIASYRGYSTEDLRRAFAATASQIGVATDRIPEAQMSAIVAGTEVLARLTADHASSPDEVARFGETLRSLAVRPDVLPETRRVCLKGIGEIEYADAIPSLLSMLGDADVRREPTVARPLCLALARLKSGAAIPGIASLLAETDDEYVFASAARALGYLGTEQALIALNANADRFSGDYCGVAIRMLKNEVLNALGSFRQQGTIHGVRAVPHFYRQEDKDLFKPILMDLLFDSTDGELTRFLLDQLGQLVTKAEAGRIVSDVPRDSQYGAQWDFIDNLSKTAPLKRHVSQPQQSRVPAVANLTTQEYGDAGYRDNGWTDWSGIGPALGHTGIFAGIDGAENKRIIEVGPFWAPVVKHNNWEDMQNGDTSYWGAKSLDNLSVTFEGRRNVVSTAIALMAEDIGYPFLNLFPNALDMRSNPGPVVDPGDISRIRCDGLVEYCYEYNGMDVWGPNGTNYDISNPANVSAHNNFYETFPSSNPDTELAPVVQAGEAGGTSTHMTADSQAAPPSFTGVGYVDVGNDIVLSLTATDVSGIHAVFYKIGPGGSWQSSPVLSQHPNYNSFTTQFTFQLASADSIYYYAVDNAGNGTPADAESVWVVPYCDPLTMATGPVPATGAYISSSPSVLDWDDVPNATSYDVYLDGLPVGTVFTSEWTILQSLNNGLHSWRIDARSTCAIETGVTWNFVLTATPPVQYVNGTIDTEVTWSSDTVYIVDADLAISASGILHIPGGTVIKFYGGNRRLVVNGVLDTQGSAGNEVVFTSWRDDNEGGDTDGDGGANSPAPGQWGYVGIYNSNNVIRHCRFKYGGYYAPSIPDYLYVLSIAQLTPAVTVEDCSFEYLYSGGVDMDAHLGFATTPVIQNNTFINVPTGISLVGDSVLTTATISGNVMTGGSGTGIGLSGLAAGSVISGNQMTGFGVGIASSSISSGVTITNNMVDGGSLNFTNCSPVVTGNAIKNSPSYPLVHVNTSFPSYSGNAVSGNPVHAISVSGTIAQSGEWVVLSDALMDMVYVLTGDVTLNAGATLSLPPASVIKFYGGNRRLVVNGVLDTQGSAGNEVVFTSWRDDNEGGDTDGDGGANSPAPGQWGYVGIYNSNNVIRHCRFKYGGYYAPSIPDYLYVLSIAQLTPAVTVEDCSFESLYSGGVDMYAHLGFATTPVIQNNTFINVPTGISLVGDSVLTTATISGNVMTGGSGTGIGLSGLAAGSVISGNQMTGFGVGIASSSISSGVTITNNMVDGGSLNFTNCSPVVTGNAIKNSPSYPLVHVNTSFPSYSGNAVSGNPVHAISVSGTIAQSGEWVVLSDALMDMVYVLTGDVTLNAGATLSLPPASVIKFYGGNRRLVVNGVLDTQGSAGNEVVFTSWRDDNEGGDTDGDGGANSPAPGQWGYVGIYNSNNVIRHCRFKYGGYYAPSIPDYLYVLSIAQLTPAVTVEDCSFEYLYSGGVDMDAHLGFATTPVIQNNTFINVPTGISLVGDSVLTTATISGNVMTGGSGTGIGLSGLAAGSVISGNQMTGFGVGIASSSISSGVTITNNMVDGGSLNFTNCSPVVTGNAIKNSPSYPLVHVNTSFPSYSGNAVSGNPVHAISVSGTIAQSGEWVVLSDALMDMVYVLTGDVTLNAGATLSLPPASVIKFYGGNRRLVVNGVLDTQGSAGNEVVFTSWRDDNEGGDTDGDGGANSPAPGQWGYVGIYNSNNVIRHCRFKYGGYYAPSIPDYLYVLSIAQLTPAVTVEDCSFESLYSGGVDMYAHLGFATTPVIQNNTFINVPTGISLVGDSVLTTATISGNVMTGGSGTGIGLSGLAAGSVISGNLIENASVGIDCAKVRGTILNNGLSQTGASISTGTAIFIDQGSDVLLAGNLIERFAVGVHGRSGSSNPPSTVMLQQNRIIDNADKGLLFESTSTAAYTGPFLTANDNDIHGNGNYNLYLGPYQNPSTTVLDVRNNWWGSSDPVVVAVGIFHYDGGVNPTSPIANFEPFKTEPIVPGAPSISVSPASLTFSLFPGAQGGAPIAIQNTGTANILSYSITEGVGGTAVSVEAGAGAVGLVFKERLGPEIAPSADVTWLDESPTSGDVAPMSGTSVSVSVNSAGLAEASYKAFLVVFSNDTDNNPLVVPVTMNVGQVFVQGPTPGQVLLSGSSYVITWTTFQPATVSAVDLYYSKDGGASFSPIATGEPNDGAFDWDVPYVLSEECVVKVVAHYPAAVEKQGVSEGLFTISSDPVTGTDSPAQTSITLSQNYPNPFNPQTSIVFAVPEAARVNLAIFDIHGRWVTTLVNRTMHAGTEQVTWQGIDDTGRRVGSGVYFYRLEVGSEVVTRKMVLLK